MSRRPLCLLLLALASHAAVTGTFPTSTKWRVLNAQTLPIGHWKIGELIMWDADGVFPIAQIDRVICSHDYNSGRACAAGDDNSKLYDGDGAIYDNGDGTNVWAGGTDALEPCASWLGYEFNSPVSIQGLKMAQADGSGVEIVALEAFNEGAGDEGEWQFVTNVHFESAGAYPDGGSFMSFVGRVDPPTDPPSQKTCMPKDPPIWPVYVFGGLFLVILVAVIYCVRKHCCKAKGKELSPSTASPSSASMAASPAVQMQSMAMPVAAEPVQQPAVLVATVPAMQHVQQPAAGTMMVTCPPGLKEGDMLQVASPTGQMVQVVVPPGVQAGGQFMVQMPAAPAVVNALPY